jgi:hypothetical protein
MSSFSSCRATVNELLEHKWVTGSDIATVQLTSALEELRRFNARRKLRAAITTVSTTLTLTKVSSPRGTNEEEEVSADGVAIDVN